MSFEGASHDEKTTEKTDSEVLLFCFEVTAHLTFDELSREEADQLQHFLW